MQVITIEAEVWRLLNFRLERMAEQIEEIGNKDPDKIFTIEQAAEYLGVERRWVDYRKKAIGYFKEARTVRIKKSAIDKYLEKHTIIKK